MANVKVFADNQTDGQTNGQAKYYMPPIYPCAGINIAILAMFNLSSANVLNLIKSKILLFGKELTHKTKLLLLPQRSLLTVTVHILSSDMETLSELNPSLHRYSF